MRPFEIIDHTADIGLRLYGKTLEELLEHAAEGLYAIMTDPQKPASTEMREISLEAQDAGDLLSKWLRELLFYFSAKRQIFNHFEFKKINPKVLKVKASGYCFDPAASDQKLEVKAVTYHGFEIQQTPDGWQAKVILDI